MLSTTSVPSPSIYKMFYKTFPDLIKFTTMRSSFIVELCIYFGRKKKFNNNFLLVAIYKTDETSKKLF